MCFLSITRTWQRCMFFTSVGRMKLLTIHTTRSGKSRVICTARLTWHTEVGLANERFLAPPNAHPAQLLRLGDERFVLRHRQPASGLMCHADIGQRWHKLEDAVAICVGLTSVRCSTSVALSRALGALESSRLACEAASAKLNKLTRPGYASTRR